MLSLSAKKQINWRTCLFSRKILRLRFGLNVSRLFHFFLLLGDGINYLTKIHLFLNKYTSLQKMKTLILSMDCLRDHLQVTKKATMVVTGTKIPLSIPSANLSQIKLTKNFLASARVDILSLNFIGKF